ncbi:hypothetical protein HMI54_002057 [Coelomomyces lativittatus]|nr:hypothetical protein HMI55_005745 [Coelomomyces lativittatus]KAJ1514933.1 hypothetical protein HMI56_007068 [Coelomomyces lativittatus]KAJ1518206.1 hypothetical protein HMI54_002057 [Coelomomyces lativittatus]
MNLLFFLAFFGLMVQVVHAQSVITGSQACSNCVPPPDSAIQNIFKLETQAYGTTKSCGDKICNTAIGETCANCPSDCGSCVYTSAITKCVNTGHVHLSFDDGPTDFLPKLLDLLKSLNIKASFYLNGVHVMETIDPASVTGKISGFTTSARSDAVKRAYAEGHVIGTHTFSHVGLVTGSTGSNQPSAFNYMFLSDIRLQMLMNDIVIYDILGKYPLAFRPAYLEENVTVINIIESMGYIPISINVDSKDYESTSSSAVLTNVNTDLSTQKNMGGFICLFHDGYQVTLDSLPTVVNQLKQQGLTLVDLPTCLNKPVSSFYRASSLFSKAGSSISSSSTSTTTTTTTTTTSSKSSTSSTTSTSMNPKTSIQSSAGSYLVAEWMNYLIHVLSLGLAAFGLI